MSLSPICGVCTKKRGGSPENPWVYPKKRGKSPEDPFRPNSYFLPAKYAYAQPVVFEIPESISSALNQLHFPVKAFSDAVVACKTKHPRHFFLPRGQCFAKSFQGLKRALAKLPDAFEQCVDMRFALATTLSFETQQFIQLMAELVNRLQGRLRFKILLKFVALFWAETASPSYQQAHESPSAIRDMLFVQQLACFHHVVLDQTNHMKAVTDNDCVGKPLPDKAAICGIHVNADNTHPLSPL